MEIYLIRHTTPDVAKGVIYGRLDVPLKTSFEQEADLLSEKLPTDIQRVYSSPSQRCMRLAEKITDLLPKSDSRLMECDFGEWEGQTWETVNQAELSIWMKDFVNVAPPKGENMHDMKKRIMDFWDELASSKTDKVAVVTHGGVIRILLTVLNKQALSLAFERKVEYGEVIKVLYNRG